MPRIGFREWRSLLQICAAWLLCVGSSATLAEAIECGDTLVGPGTYQLNEDLLCDEAGPGLRLTDGALLVMNGHSIAGRSAFPLEIVGEGVRVVNGRVGGEFLIGGIRVEGRGHRLIGLTVEQEVFNGGECCGLLVTEGTEGVDITRSVIRVRGVPAIDLRGSGHTVSRNEISPGPLGGGGSLLVDGTGHRILRNLIEGSGRIAFVEGSSGHLIARNVVRNASAGILITSNVTQLVVRRNRLENNRLEGIRVSAASQSIFSGNWAFGNGGGDLVDATSNCVTNVWRNNRAGVKSVGGTLNHPCMR